MTMIHNQKEELLFKLTGIQEQLEKLEAAIDAAFSGISTGLIEEQLISIEEIEAKLLHAEKLTEMDLHDDQNDSRQSAPPIRKVGFGY
ncbi:hypothetical protein D1B31_10160 [Neobacillus notoginsengisoli]|uniref:Uncharacterized protein n=1 Tax=Neobacillus notoginsengisoli TaxID=1578198 RepID=A0A417YVR8_9BACI|nr:hypothetical protein [Neobacillus notoginsengisoli]RHW41285.1 hypothetical protein D1B31_10160 [Neobacillus notoginsengisoli]